MDAFKQNDIVQMSNTSFHGNTKGQVQGYEIAKDGQRKVKIIWGDFSHKMGWFQTTLTREQDLKLAE